MANYSYFGYNNGTFYKSNNLSGALGLQGYINPNSSNLGFIVNKGITYPFTIKNNFTRDGSFLRSANFMRVNVPANSGINGGFDYKLRIDNPKEVNGFISKLKDSVPFINKYGVGDEIEELLQAQAKKKDKKSFEDIVNLIFNYGEKAVGILTSFGLLKSNTDPNPQSFFNEDDLEGWEQDPNNEDVIKKPEPKSDSNLIFGFTPIEAVLGVSALGLIGYVVTQQD